MQIDKILTRNTIFTTHESPDGTVNTGIIRGVKHNFIIDTGTGGDFAKAMLAELADSDLPIIVINTHHHWDHVYGNWVFADKEIIAHKLCAKLLDNDWSKKMAEVQGRGRIFLGEVKKCLPNRLIDADLHFPEDGVKIFMNPGHSADSISVYDEIDKVLYLGDNFGVDEDGLSFWGYNGDFEAEDIDEKYEAAFFEMIAYLKQFGFESAIVTHGGHFSRGDFDKLEADFKED